MTNKNTLPAPDIPAHCLGAHGSGGENNHNPLSTLVFGEENNLLTRGPDSGDRRKPTKTDTERKDDKTTKPKKTQATGKQTKKRQKEQAKQAIDTGGGTRCVTQAFS